VRQAGQAVTPLIQATGGRTDAAFPNCTCRNSTRCDTGDDTMKTALFTAGAALLAFTTAAQAQDAPPAGATTETTMTTTTPTENGNGADVSLTTSETTTTTPNEDGSATVDTSSSTQQRVTTPSGNTTTVTRTIDEMGARMTTVDHTRAEAGVHTGHPNSKKPK
jgi:hypothetical protein